MAQKTKIALAESLKHLLTNKPLDKITVIDIVEDCDVNRQTFYYHFQDIYDLVEWTLIAEAEKALDGNKTYDTWQQGFLQIFEYVIDNKPLISNVYFSNSRDRMERYLYQMTYDLLIAVVEEKAATMSVRTEDKRFIADFYKFAFVGLMLEWIRTGMKEEPQKIVDHLSDLIHGEMERALEKYRMDRKIHK